jgi:3-isopropylmalate dehydrogenase
MEGDGIGPEISAVTVEVLRAADRKFGLGLAFATASIGLVALRQQGTTFPQAAFEAAQSADGVVLGPVSHNDYPPVAEGGLNPSGELRKRLDLFANIRPARTRGGFPPRCGSPVDLVIVRENTEGFYADRSCRPPTSRSRSARSRGPAAPASPRPRSGLPCGGAGN